MKDKKETTAMNEIIVLGSGTSTGIPMIGCKCKVCTSENPKNQRTRTSIFLHTKNNKSILIDTAPDLRWQFLDNDINHLDAVIITHDHADHLHGIDDLRPLCFGPPPRTIPVYSSSKSQQAIINRFPYIFQAHIIFSAEKPVIGGGIPRLELKTIDLTEQNIVTATIEDEQFHFFYLPHGYKKTMGFVHEKFAYLTDCQAIPNEVLKFLQQRKTELIIIDCVQKDPHDTHLYVENCFEYIKLISPEKAGIIHMNHDLEHDELQKMANKCFKFPVFPVYDGQRIYYS